MKFINENTTSIAKYLSVIVLLVTAVNFAQNDIFSEWDKNNDGELSESEFLEGFSNDHYSEWDANNDGSISSEEFYKSTFDVIDEDGNKEINTAEKEWGFEHLYGDYVEYNVTVKNTEDTTAVDSQGYGKNTEDTTAVDSQGYGKNTEDTTAVDSQGYGKNTEDTTAVDSQGYGKNTEDTTAVDSQGYVENTEDTTAIDFQGYKDSVKDTEFYSENDSDGDSMLNETELSKAVFKSLDENKDGTLSSSEFESFQRYFFEKNEDSKLQQP